MDVRAGLWLKLSTEKLMVLNYGVGEDSWESLGLQGDPTSPSERRSVLGVHWKDCWSWNSNTLATSCEELTCWKRPWCWEGLGAGGQGADRGWDGWMASLTWCTWAWVKSGSFWWTGRPGVLQFMELQRIGHDWVTELNWTVLLWSDWLVFCDYGFSVFDLWCPLAPPTVLLGFLFPWTWGSSSLLLQQSATAAPYLGGGVSSHGRPLWPWTWSSSSWPSCARTAAAPWRWCCFSRLLPLTLGIG